MDIRDLQPIKQPESSNSSRIGRVNKLQDKPVLEDAKLKQACADFEGVLLNFMFQSMKKTLPGKGVFSGSHQKEVFESMFFQEISTKLARERGVGIGNALYRQLKGKINGPETK